MMYSSGFLGFTTNKAAEQAKYIMSDTDIPIITTGATASELTKGQKNGNFFRSSMSDIQELEVSHNAQKELTNQLV